MRRALVLLFLLPALVLSALAVAPSGPASADDDARVGTAVAPAAVRSVLKQTPGGALKGRLISSRDDCVKDRDVYLVIRQDGLEYPNIAYLGISTNNQGRWTYDEARRRGVTIRLAALTLGGPRCEVAQSNQITYDTTRTGAGVSPAAGTKPADVSITLEGGQFMNLHGKISSSRDVCHEYRPVFVFYREAGTHDPFQATIVSISRKNGKYFYNENGSDPGPRGVTNADVITVVPGTNNCAPAQSKLKELGL